eukprot:Gb_36765 [translate_table: standard]
MSSIGKKKDAFVLCRVSKKRGPGAKSGEQYGLTSEENESSPTENNPSLDKTVCCGNIGEQSEDRSKPEEIQVISSLPSETSSEVLNDMTEDIATLDTWLDILLDDTNSNSVFIPHSDDTTNTEADSTLGAPRSQCECTLLLDAEDFPEIPTDLSFTEFGSANGYLIGEKMDAYFEEERILEEMLQAASEDSSNHQVDDAFPSDTFADILNGDYIELDNLIPSMEELENHESYVSEVLDCPLDHEETGIQIRSRSSTLKNNHQGLASQGTASRRIRMRMYTTEVSADRNEQDFQTRHKQPDSNNWYDSNNGSGNDLQAQQLLFDSFNGQKCNPEGHASVPGTNQQIIAEHEDCAWGALSKQRNTGKDGLPWYQQAPVTCRGYDVNDCSSSYSQTEILSLQGNNTHSITSNVNGMCSKPNELSSPLQYCSEVIPGGLHVSEKHQIIDAQDFCFVPDSVEMSKSISIRHSLTSMPPQTSIYGLFLNKEASQIIEMSSNASDASTIDESSCVNKWQTLSHTLTSSSTAVDAKPAKQSSGMSTRKEISDSKINEQSLVGELSSNLRADPKKPSTAEYVQKCEIAESEDDIAAPTQVMGSGEGSVPGTAPASPGNSVEFQSGKNASALNSSEMLSLALPREDSLPSKSIQGSDVATNCDSIQVATVSANVTTMTLTSTCSEGSAELPGSDIISSGLRHRVKSEPEGILFDSEEKSAEITDELFKHCDKQRVSGTSLSLEMPSRVFRSLSQLGRRWSFTGSNGDQVDACTFISLFLISSWSMMNAQWLVRVKEAAPHVEPC